MTNPAAGDNRRATALVVHYGNDNLDGVNAILREAVEVDRVSLLIANVVDLHDQIVPILLTEDGIACLSQMMYSLAEDQDADPDFRRAARLIIAHAQRDLDTINTVLAEAAAADHVTGLVLAVLGTYRSYLPLLYSQLGLRVLQRSALDWAARENTTDDDQEDDTE